MVKLSDDFLKRLLAYLVQTVGPETFTETMAVEIERAMREEWGGDRPYIAKSGEAGGAWRTERDRSIIRDMEKGERPPLLARRYGISREQVWRIWRRYKTNGLIQ